MVDPIGWGIGKIQMGFPEVAFKLSLEGQHGVLQV